MANFISVWFNACIYPKKTFAEEKSKASLKKGIIYILISYAIAALLLNANFIDKNPNLFNLENAFWTILLFLFITAVFQLAMYGIARIGLEAKGKLEEQVYLNSLFYVPFAIVYSLILIFSPPAILGTVLGWAFLVLILYEAYLTALILQETYKISFGNAVFVLLAAAGITFFVLALILFINDSIKSSYRSSGAGYNASKEYYHQRYNELFHAEMI